MTREELREALQQSEIVGDTARRVFWLTVLADDKRIDTWIAILQDAHAAGWMIFDIFHDYDDAEKIEFSRPLTAEERAAQEAKAQAAQEAKRAQEEAAARAQYAKLKARFEPNDDEEG